MGNCFTCKYCMHGYHRYLCTFQNYQSIHNKSAECPYYKKSLIDKIIDFLCPEKEVIPPSDNLSPPPRPEPPSAQGGW